ncbi:hypothetical protein C496_07233 [Natronorubrum tibetense GA33]|uniref:Uncharacterized protein n=1 Tax=Natronorubrum tibetense GA33 TaxID=1114856 RepID=L9VYS1_9EURY|nr:hypothetical protein C496_07233 [Natronorubrum tibetense GA33]
MQSPFVMFVDDFSGSNAPVIVCEGGSHPVEMLWITTKFAFDVVAWGSTDTEPNRIIIFEEKSVPFFMVHDHRVQSVDVWVWSAPIVVFVVVVGFDFTEGFVYDELTGVFNVIRIVHDDRFEFFPVPALFIEAVGFVTDASGFETAVLQVVGTPRVNV